MSQRVYAATIKDSDLSEGKMRAIRVKGKPVLLVKVGGQIYAVSNLCPHEGCSFQTGILTDYIVMCPCHGWKYDIRNGQPQQNPPTLLATYPTKIQNGKIYVGMG